MSWWAGLWICWCTVFFLKIFGFPFQSLEVSSLQLPWFCPDWLQFPSDLPWTPIAFRMLHKSALLGIQPQLRKIRSVFFFFFLERKFKSFYFYFYLNKTKSFNLKKISNLFLELRKNGFWFEKDQICFVIKKKKIRSVFVDAKNVKKIS